MPFIEIKTNVAISGIEKDEISKELGKRIELLDKTENWLMINISDVQDMYFAGSDDDCIIVEVKLYGEPNVRSADEFTGSVTNLLHEMTDVDKNRIYVSYFSTNNWGWNGSNF